MSKRLLWNDPVSSNKPIPAAKFLIAAKNGDWAHVADGYDINNSLIIGATNKERAHVGNATDINNSLIIGATNRNWTCISRAYNINNSLIIGATNGWDAEVGYARISINNSLIIGATNGESGCVVGHTNYINNSLIIGATNGRGADVGHADAYINNSLIIGATNGRGAHVGHAYKNIENSLIIGATNGRGAEVGYASTIQNSLIIGATNGEGAEVGRAYKNIKNSLIIGATNGKYANVGRASTIKNSLIIDTTNAKVRVYDERGNMSHLELPRKDMQMLRSILKIRTKKEGKDRFVQKLKTDGKDINLPAWYDGMVTDWQGAEGVGAKPVCPPQHLVTDWQGAEDGPTLDKKFIDKNVKPPAENLWTTKNIAFNGSELYIPDGTFGAYFHQITNYEAISELLEIEGTAKYVPEAVKKLLNAQVGVNLCW